MRCGREGFRPSHSQAMTAVALRLQRVLGRLGDGPQREAVAEARAAIGPAERVVTIEDAAELRLQQPH